MTAPSTGSGAPLRASAWLALALAACATRGANGIESPQPADPARARPPDEVPAAAYDRAARTFAAQCALCHGERGRGDGPAAALLFPPARDFGEGRFQLVSTANGAPADEDVERVLRRGVPGSAMPAYDWMSGDEIDELVAYVRRLAVAGMADRLVEQAEQDGAALGEDEALALARERLAPGARIDPGGAAAHEPATLQRGRELYAELCAACHGDDGSGRREEPRWNERGDIEWARDFTAGILKGGASHAELTWRIAAGMPGSSMPAVRLADPADRAALVAFVQSLIPADAGERLVRHRRRIDAARVAALPDGPDDPLWDGSAEVEVVLAPNAWRDDAVFAAALSAVHDGESIAVRVRWRDATCNDRPYGEFELSDAAALMLSDEAQTPRYGMGSPGAAVDIWHWKAFRFEEHAGMLDLLEHPPHSGYGVPDVPLYVPGRDLAAEGQAHALRAEGMDSTAEAARGLAIDARARWKDGGWCATFARPLAARARREIALAPGARAQIALAIWNGAARDAGGQKSLTVWHEIALEP